MPENFPVTNELVKHLLNRGKTLEEEMAVSLDNNLHMKLIHTWPSYLYIVGWPYLH